MRTFRELYGWLLGVIAWAIPFASLVVLVIVMDDDLPGGALLLALGALLLIPRLLLSARRFREPLPEDIAEADGRRPVIVVHGFAHAHTPLLSRLFAFQPGLWRELGDAWQLTALTKGLGDAGPIVPIARPAPPPAHGPMASLRRDAGFGDALEAELRTARMAVIVLDGTESSVAEIDRAARTIGLPKTVLVTPSKIDGAFLAGWEKLRAARPGLPAIDARVAAVRWADDGVLGALCATMPGLGARQTLLRQPGLMLRKGEARPAPKPPSIAKLLLAVPVFAGVVGIGLVPAMGGLANLPGGGRESDLFAWGLISFVLGIVLAVMGRRAIRLVAANELPMLVVASMPWWFPELIGWLEGNTNRPLVICARGALCSAPLLLATAVVLSGGSLMRRMPGRRAAFAVFGVAALIPLGVLFVTLSFTDERGLLFFFSLVAGAVVLGLSTVAATGDAGRRHAPLPLGAVSATVMALAAVGFAVSHGAMAGVFDLDSQGYLTMRDRMHALDEFGESAPWFLWALPVAIALIAMQFKGRVTRVSVGSVAALIPLVLVLPLASANEEPARAFYAMRMSRFGGGLSRAAGGAALVPTFEAPSFEYGDRVERVDMVVDAAGAIVDGQRVASPSDLAGWGGSDLNRELGRLGRESDAEGVRIAIDEHASAGAVVGVVRVALDSGADRVLLVGRDDYDLPVGIPIRRSPFSDPRLEQERIRLVVVVRHDRYSLMDTAGTRIELPDQGGEPNVSALRERLRERHQYEPNRQDLEIAAEPGVEASRLSRAVQSAYGEGFSWLSLRDGSQL